MALKATIRRATLQLADIDRQVYGEHSLTLAQHPSETDERLMVRLLAFALHRPADTHRGALQFARGLSDADEPDLWQKDLTDQLVHWIEVGQPDERRLARACGRAEQVTIVAYAAATPIWYAGLAQRITRLGNLAIWQLPAAQSQALAALAGRAMQLHVTVQDGQVWVGDSDRTVELQPLALWRGGR